MTRQIDFSRFSSIKIGPITEVHVVNDCSEIPEHAAIIGSSSNILLSNTPPPLYMLSKAFDFIMIKNDLLHIGAATPSGKIVSFCKKHDIGGFEFLAHLPGKLGGLVKMNAGLKEYEIFNNLISLRTCSGKFPKESLEFGYRYTKIEGMILEAAFAFERGFDPTKVEMFRKMRSNQPATPSAGSCFKNPSGDYAGRLIEAVGLKGKRVGGMGWSDVHANFLVNYGGGTFVQAMELIEEAEQKVLAKYNIALEREIIIL